MRKDSLFDGTIKCDALILLFSIVFAFCIAGCGVKLEQNFVNPPDSSKPHTWWHWMNGNVTKEGITADLEAMKKAGIGGFQAFHISGAIPAGPVGYMSDIWHDMMKHTVKEASRLGLELCFHNCAGWSSSGGPWITPEYAMQKVVWTEKQVSGPNDFSGQLEQPETKYDYYRDIAVLAFPTPQSEYEGEGNGFRIRDWKSKAGFERNMDLKHDNRQVGQDDVILKNKVIVLSNRMDSSGQLQWQVPEGKWTIIRFGYTPTGRENAPAPLEGRGLECDKLNPKAAELHWANSAQKVIEDAGPLTGEVFNNVLIDSYEMYCQNWTHRLPQEFKKRTDYDITLYLPVLTGRVVDSVEISERFLWDFRKAISDMFVEYYYSHFAEMCHRNGLKLSVEPYGNGNFDDFTVASMADIPMGEFWASANKLQWCDCSGKLAAAAAHTYGRKYVGAEAFTAGGKHLKNHPYMLKAQGDYFYCQGVNRFIFHTYAHQPWVGVLPGMTMYRYGTAFNSGNTWYAKASSWTKYLARCQYLLQEGKFIADICYYAGEDVPNSMRPRSEIEPSPPLGYDYDFCTTENLMQMSVKNGIISLPSGMSYRVLVLPTGPVRPDILRQVGKLTKAGAVVYAARPDRAPGLQNYPLCDSEVKKLTDEFRGKTLDITAKEQSFWKGKIAWSLSLAEVLSSIGVLPDFEFDRDISDVPTLYSVTGIEYIHRKIGSADIYFISNQRKTSNMIRATFRITGRRPELWHPDTGEIKETPLYSFTEDGRTVVLLSLEPAGSVFVVFRKPVDKKRVESVAFKAADSDEDVRGPQLEIKRAIYGVLSGTPNQQVDVTENLRKIVRAGRLTVKADNDIAGDPAYKIVKELKIDYLVDGRPFSKKINENEILVLPEPETKEGVCFKVRYEGKEIVLATLKPGLYEIRKEDGQTTTIKIDEIPEPVNIDGPWTLHFPKGWGAPEEIELEKLIDWTTHKNYDIQHFSGTATYSKTFDVPAEQICKDESVFLDLGIVNVIAEVKLNGKNMGILWKPPFRVDVSDVIRSGQNHLEIEVTNLWPNRLIGDAKYPDDCQWEKDRKSGYKLVALPEWLKEGKSQPADGRKAFSTWKWYDENDPLLPSGLLGPVQLICTKTVVLE